MGRSTRSGTPRTCSMNCRSGRSVRLKSSTNSQPARIQGFQCFRRRSDGIGFHAMVGGQRQEADRAAPDPLPRSVVASRSPMNPRIPASAASSASGAAGLCRCAIAPSFRPRWRSSSIEISAPGCGGCPDRASGDPGSSIHPHRAVRCPASRRRGQTDAPGAAPRRPRW